MNPAADSGPRPLAARAAQGFLFALIAGVIFQCLNVSVKTLAHELPPLLVAWGRWLTGLVLIAPFVLRDGMRGLRTRDLRLHGLRALFHTSGYALWYTAVALIPLATTAALSFTGPIFVTLGAALFLGETVRWPRWLAVAAGFIGVLVILRPGLAAIEPGALVMLAAVPLIAGSNLVAKVVAGRDSPAQVVFWQSAFGVLCFAPFGLWFWQTPSASQLLLFLAAGLTGTVAYFFMTWAFRLLDISAIQPLTFLGIVWATLFDWLVFDAVADGWTFVGAAIIVSATTFIARREGAARAQRAAP
ncbi:MAG: DMT family transporter, partial [Burkholderiales bacterium]|nr:DMT family transporter [Burkholderiales bacterium]